MEWTKEQKHAMLSLLKGVKAGEQVQTLGGYAGTGKTTTIRQIKDALQKKNMHFAVAAYTGKAANVLRSKGIDACTIHKLIYAPFKDEDGDTVWYLKDIQHPDLIGVNGFIIDEASMVSKEIYEDLCSYKKPIIFVGDHGQLEPIGGSKFNLMASPMYRLEEVHRNAGEIALFAEHLRKDQPAHTFKAEKQVQLVRPASVFNNHLAGVDQVIVAYNRERVSINQRVREYKRLDYVTLAEGEKVICLRNNHREGLFNGQQGIVTSISEDGDRFDFRSDDNMFLYNILYDPDIFGLEKPEIDHRKRENPFDYAYAITCHKAQGDEWGSVIVFEKHCSKWEHRRWAYTAASRAAKSLIWAVDV
jgi:exodeoxyribonuclease-5